MSKKLKIISIASEVAPFSKTGGLADVTRSLSKALTRLGHEIIVITPLYGKIIDKKKFNLELVERDIDISLNPGDSIKVSYWRGYLREDLPVYFVECKKYFSRKKAIYGSRHENARFFIFNAAALKLAALLKFKADIVHCHDWQTGLIPYLLKTRPKDYEILRNAKSVFTIHNLAFQLGRNWWEVPAEKKDYGKSDIPALTDPNIEYLNFAKRGILFADIINTVSEQYREEIMTKKFGQDLHCILRNRSDRLYGIINGIDYNAYNPANDPGLVKKFNEQSGADKIINKEHVQKMFNLAPEPGCPLICSTSRVTFQKGFELIVKLLEPLAKLDLQLIIMGNGDKEYINALKKIRKKYPKKIYWTPFDQKIETLIYAGADLFLLPSYHEPCGINQLIAMRYGAIPIIRKVGGLNDTVDNFDVRKPSRGTGFSFKNFDKFSLYGTIIRALETYKQKNYWNMIVSRALKQSNSWEIPAKKYVKLFRKAING
ncbi:MAG: glycogen/starch synthase [Patescibacteria group bacterium]|jgi:starch synthase